MVYMAPRSVLTTIGAGITTFLLISVLIIELLDMEFSAIIGLPVGVVAGIVVSVVLWVARNQLSPGVRRAVTAYATFGVALLVLLALRYVNIGRGVLRFEVLVGGSIAAVVVVYIVLYLIDSNRL
jgi:hypothetical protein